MSTEETEARLLAEWLATPAGTPPPEGLSSDVVAAVYAMRPDRAPAPRVSIEDIFGKVEKGPFAEAVAEAGAARAPLGTTRRGAGTPGPVRPERKPARRVGWWAAPAVGVVVSAAAAVLFVLPMGGQAPSPTATKLAQEASEAHDAAMPTPAAAPMGGASAPAEPIAEASAPADAAPSGAVGTKAVPAAPGTAAGEGAAGKTAGNLGPADDGRSRMEDVFGREKADAGGADAPDGSAPAANGVGGLAAGGGGSASGSYGSQSAQRGGAGYAAPMEEAQGQAAVADKDAAMAPAPPPPPAPVTAAAPAAIPELTTTASTGSNDAWGQASAREAKKAEAKPASAPKAKTSAPAKAPAPSMASAPRSAPAADRGADAMEMEDDAGALAKEAPALDQKASSSTRGDSASGRADAVPRDYSSSALLGRADVAAAYATAQTAAASGRIDDAVAAYTPLLSDSDARVAQDAAWRCALAQSAAGRASAASATVSRGLGRSSANTPYRSNLLVLQGDLAAARGDAAGAAKAWADAARLNAAR